jgi:hypothetical protein
MKWAFSTLLVLVTTASAFSASAASLRVDAGVLQTWAYDVDLCRDHAELCVPAEDPHEVYELEVEVWRMDGHSGKREGIDAYPYRYRIPTGEPYLIAWSNGDPERACHKPGSSHSAPRDPFGFEGPRAGGYFEPGSDVVHHVVCVQRGAVGEPAVSIASGEVSPESAPDGAELSTSLSVKASEDDELATSADAAAPEPTDEEHIDPNSDPAGDK